MFNYIDNVYSFTFAIGFSYITCITIYYLSVVGSLSNSVWKWETVEGLFLWGSEKKCWDSAYSGQKRTPKCLDHHGDHWIGVVSLDKHCEVLGVDNWTKMTKSVEKWRK